MSGCRGNKVKILIVEDNKSIIESLEYLLEKEGFEVNIVSSKKQALEYIKADSFDLFLLDVELPDGTGFEICRYIKNISNKPIIFVSARIEESNIVYGLDLGADDYITKPFGNNELVSRIRSVLRRYSLEVGYKRILVYGDLKVDIDKAKVYKNQEELFLTKLEYKILLMFLNNENKIITRDELLEKIWDIDGNYVNDNTLSVYIRRLRDKISDRKSKDKQLIQTVRGMGYILNKISD
ncbi:MAG: response regulator transcription factor [Clostridia bacterium]|nr:response regulator transcription factor [Clostridia bacterium]